MKKKTIKTPKVKIPKTKVLSVEPPKVKLEIEAKEGLTPINNNDGTLDLLLNVALKLLHRSVACVDFGIKIKVPENYQLNLVLKRDVAAKGVVLSGVKLEPNGFLTALLINVGNINPLVLEFKTELATLSITPRTHIEY